MTPASGEISTRRSLDGLSMVLLRQNWAQPDLDNLKSATMNALESAGALERIGPGDTIAITAGSRGIAAVPTILRNIVDAVRSRGGEPFVFPAMGSHGGGVASGQVALLESLGINERTVGAPVRASMEVVKISETARGLPVYLDAIASRADGIIMLNRIKKHTNFDGPIESGLCKMAVIGMGKHTQAAHVHQFGNYGLREYIPEIAADVFARAPVLAGLALLENAWGGVADLVGLRAKDIVEAEPALFQRAKRLGAKIPFARVDIAVVEQMGKDISGTGMDCYVIGRRRIIGEPEWPEAPDLSSLVVLDLTEASHGNAVGVGLADFTTRTLADKIDWPSVRANVLTSGNMERAKLPLALDTDREAIEVAGYRERNKPLETLKVVCVRDTLHLRHLLVSEELAREASSHPDLAVVGGTRPLAFDAKGRWVSPFSGG